MTEDQRRECHKKYERETLNNLESIEEYIKYCESNIKIFRDSMKPLLAVKVKEDESITCLHICKCRNCQSLFYEANAKLQRAQDSLCTWLMRKEVVESGGWNEYV